VRRLGRPAEEGLLHPLPLYLSSEAPGEVLAMTDAEVKTLEDAARAWLEWFRFVDDILGFAPDDMNTVAILQKTFEHLPRSSYADSKKFQELLQDLPSRVRAEWRSHHLAAYHLEREVWKALRSLRDLRADHEAGIHLWNFLRLFPRREATLIARVHEGMTAEGDLFAALWPKDSKRLTKLRVRGKKAENGKLLKVLRTRLRELKWRANKTLEKARLGLRLRRGRSAKRGGKAGPIVLCRLNVS
jgi:hypothetical protein